MALLNFRHLGLSIPLYDHQNGNEKMAGFFDPLNPWKYHLSDRYNNLLTLDAVEIDNIRAEEVVSSSGESHYEFFMYAKRAL